MRWPLLSLAMAIHASMGTSQAQDAQNIFIGVGTTYQVNESEFLQFNITPSYRSGSFGALNIFQSSASSNEGGLTTISPRDDPNVQNVTTGCEQNSCSFNNSTGQGNIKFAFNPPHWDPFIDLNQKYYLGLTWNLASGNPSISPSTVYFYSNDFNILDPSSSTDPGVGTASSADPSTVGSSSPFPNPITETATPSATGSQTSSQSTSGTDAPGVGQSNGNNPTVAVSSSSSSGLSTGAKAGIGVGIGVFAVLLLLIVISLWRRHRKLKRGVPITYNGAPGAVHGGLQAEKEMNVINTRAATYEPVGRHDGFEDVPIPPLPPPVTHTHEPEEESSWEEHGPGAQAQRSVPSTDEYVPSSVDHLREPGMGPEELARLEDEERRLDEAITEAERRRLSQV